jgi:hypothetical protein
MPILDANQDKRYFILAGEGSMKARRIVNCEDRQQRNAASGSLRDSRECFRRGLSGKRFFGGGNPTNPVGLSGGTKKAAVIE